MTTRTAVATAALLVVLTGACGGDDEVPGPAPAPLVVSEEPDFVSGENAPDPCTLLTPAEVEEVLLLPTTPGVRSAGAGGMRTERCTWVASNRSFTLELTDGGDVDGVDLGQLYDLTVSVLDGVMPTQGLGLRASLGAKTGIVLTEGVLVRTRTDPASESALRTLTEKAVAAL